MRRPLVLALLCVRCVGVSEEAVPTAADAQTAVVDSGLGPLDAAVSSMPDASTVVRDAGAHDAGIVQPPDAGAIEVVARADLEVHFPPPASATSEAQVLVHGSTRSGLTVTRVQVHGLTASSSDQFRTWQVTVPLTVGANSLVVDFTESGVQHAAAATISIERFADESSLARGSGTWAGRILGLAWDALGSRVILADDVEDGVWGVSVASGNRTILSDSEGDLVGAGYAIVQPRSGVVIGTTSYIVDDTLIVGIDLVSGDRAIVATAPGALNDLSLSPNGVELIAASLDLKAVLAIAPTTGQSRVISSAAVGSGPGPGNVGPLGVSASRHSAYVGLRYQDTLLAIDLETGNRRVFSEAIGGEPKLSDPEFVVVVEATGTAFVWDTARLVSVDLATGRRAVVAAASMAWAKGIHAMTSTPYGVALIDYVPSWEPPPHRAPTLLIVDPMSGGRVVLSR